MFVDHDHRGRGLGTWMVRTLVEHWRDQGVARILLVTRDAHQVYERAGFVALAHPERFMEIEARTTF